VDASGSRCYLSSQNRSVPDVVRLIEIRPSWSTPEPTYAMSSSSEARRGSHRLLSVSICQTDEHRNDAGDTRSPE